MAYTIEILGVDKTSLLKAGSLRVTRRTDKNNDCSMELITTAAGYLPKVGQDIKVKNSGTVIFGGCIKTMPHKKVEAGCGDTKKIELNVSSDGYRSIPARRTVNLSFDQKSAGYIVTHLVTYIFNTEGITAGTIDTGANPVGDAGEYDAVCKNCAEVLDDMASASGYKWYIDDTKQLHFVADDTVSDAAHDIVEGGEFTDYEIESYEPTLDQYANKVYVRGGLGDDGNVVQTFVEDATEQAAQQTIEGGATYSSGVYGMVINDSNIDLLADATTAAENALKKYGIIPSVLNITSHTLDWQPGTKIKVNLPTFGISSDTYYLIEELTLEDMDGKNLKCIMKASIRKTADFSSQSGQSGIDYLGKVVAKAKESGNKVIGGGSTSLYLESNTAEKTVNNVESVVVSKTINFAARSKALINVTAKVTPSDTLNLTTKVYVDGTALPLQPIKPFAAADTVAFAVSKDAIAAGSKAVEVKMTTSANSGTIAIGQAQLNIQVYVDSYNAPPTLLTAVTNAGGTIIILGFDKDMASPVGKHAQFSANNGAANAITAAALDTDNTKINLTVTNIIGASDTVTISYTAGTITAADTGVLASFSGQAVTNNVIANILSVGYREWSRHATTDADFSVTAAATTVQMFDNTTRGNSYIYLTLKRSWVDIENMYLSFDMVSNATGEAKGYSLGIYDGEYDYASTTDFPDHANINLKGSTINGGSSLLYYDYTTSKTYSMNLKTADVYINGTLQTTGHFYDSSYAEKAWSDFTDEYITVTFGFTSQNLISTRDFTFSNVKLLSGGTATEWELNYNSFVWEFTGTIHDYGRFDV